MPHHPVARFADVLYALKPHCFFAGLMDLKALINSPGSSPWIKPRDNSLTSAKPSPSRLPGAPTLTAPHLIACQIALAVTLFFFVTATANARTFQAICIDLGGVEINTKSERKLDQLVRQAETQLTKTTDHLVIHLMPMGDGSQAYQLARATEIADRLRGKLLAAKLPTRRVRFHWAYDAFTPESFAAETGTDCERLPNLAISVEPIPLKRD